MSATRTLSEDAGPARLNPVAAAILRGAFYPFVHALWRPRLVGREHVPVEGPCFVYGNHSNYVDPFIMNVVMGGEPTAGVMAREFLRGGVAAWLLREIGILPVSRNASSLMRAVFRLVDAGRKITIYPEGGRRWDGRPLPWIPATVKLYLKTGLPVHPVVIHGSYVAWPRWARYARPARLRVEFLPPFRFNPDDDPADALARLKAPIDFDETLVDDDVKPRWAYRPADGIEILLYRDPESGASGGLYTPDGTHVRNRSGSLHWKMLPDSTLRDVRTGAIRTTSELYRKILALPRARSADGGIVTNTVEVHHAPRFPDFRDQGRAEATLYPDAIRIAFADRTDTVPLEQVSLAQIERNWKFETTTPDGVTQLRFRFGGSALQWLDCCRALGVPTR